MELTDALHIPLPPAAVCDALQDIALLRASLENCERFSRTPNGEYEVTLTVPLGPLRARYDVRAHLGSFESQPAGDDSPGTLGDGVHRTLNFKACATGVGSLRGQIDLALRGEGLANESGEASATRIEYSVWATLTGPLAELPPRQIENALHDVADDFFAEFCAVVEAKHGKRENRAAAGMRRQHVFLRPISLAGLGRKSWEQNAAAALGGRAAGTLVSPRGAHGLHRSSTPQAMPVWGWAAIVVLVAVLLYASHWLG
ncbi:carbon monoxide dehydrogenase [Trinickia dabaoshanensis]|uniref:Carbon monoxide dehydrogenase n=1 Tax=Trinickia dabaoshanensis TaxID=564714 RepID=A0A2N7VK08_9BURK|nr:SRPBCC domain-containing protein [Trinickia dabaoshanensis]PMS17437.1 carbon monoxide dehydrogenase [Trinickia dabaoshanensis]